MIKIKLTKQGGYVCGDGPCPFDLDEFLKTFSSRMLDAQRQGLQELEIPDTTIDMLIAERKRQFNEVLDNTPVLELPDSAAAGLPALLEQGGLQV